MSEPRPTATRPVSTIVLILAFVFTLGFGFLLGNYHTAIYNSVASLLGFNVYNGSLDLSSVQATYRALKANFDGELDDQALIEGASRGLVEAADDQYTVFFSKSEAEEFSNGLSGNIGGGVGIEMGLRSDRVTVLRVLDDVPAKKAGVLAGDIVVSINDESAEDMTLDEVVQKIRGEVGTTVKLGFLRDGELETFSITREEISNPSVYSKVDGDVGVLVINRFDTQTGSLARQAAQNFADRNIKKVVVDLRGNGGGYLTAAQDVAGIWLDNKVVVSERKDGKVVDELYSSSRPILDGVPTVVLVDGSSASASEILAGALQDHGAATLVGETTFGKGSVQQLIKLPAGAELKVTIARWYTPNGQNISETGIEPDKTVERTSDDVNAGRDPQLTAAKVILSR